MKKYISFCCAMVLSIMTGCTTINNDKSDLSKSGQKKIYIIAKYADLPIQKIKGELKLEDALIATRNANPSLTVAKLKIKAAKCAISQADVFYNPEVKVEFDDVNKGRDSISQSIAISQKIEFWGKRDKRINLAKQKFNISEFELTEIQLQLDTQVRLAFLEVYNNQENLKLVASAFDIIEQNYDSIIKRIKSGEVSSIQKNKAKVELASAQIANIKANRKLKTSKINLVALWGAKTARFAKVEKLDYDFNNNLDIDYYKQNLKNHPSFFKLNSIIEKEKALLEVNKAKPYPDVKFAGKVTQIRESGDKSFSLGFSMPIPFFDLNTGAIEEAEANIERAKAYKIVKLLELEKELEVLFDELIFAKSELDIFQNDIIPASEHSHKDVNKAFEVGEQNILELLDSQHSLIKLKKTQLDMAFEFQKLIIKLNAFAGKK